MTLLPFSADALKTDEETQDVSGDLLYEPDAETLLGFVVPQYVDVQIRQGILSRLPASMRPDECNEQCDGECR